MMHRFVAPALAALSVLGCDHKVDEARRLAETIDRFRVSENAQKPAQLAAVKAAGCGDKVICDTKAKCLEMAEPIAQAIVLEAEVHEKMDLLEAGKLPKTAPEVIALPQKLDEADRLLDVGKKAIAACDQALVAMKQHVGYR
jgi:hypothetical protein